MRIRRPATVPMSRRQKWAETRRTRFHSSWGGGLASALPAIRTEFVRRAPYQRLVGEITRAEALHYWMQGVIHRCDDRYGEVIANFAALAVETLVDRGDAKVTTPPLLELACQRLVGTLDGLFTERQGLLRKRNLTLRTPRDFGEGAEGLCSLRFVAQAHLDRLREGIETERQGSCFEDLFQRFAELNTEIPNHFSILLFMDPVSARYAGLDQITVDLNRRGAALLRQLNDLARTLTARLN